MEGIEGHDGCQAAVDRGGLEALVGLLGDEAVDVVKGDGAGRPVADAGCELLEVVAVIAPGAGLGVAAAHPIDEAFNLG